MRRLSRAASCFPSRLFIASIVYSAFLMLRYGQFPGANYDSYQYIYAVLRGPLLSSRELAEFARLHVHSGYFPIWQLISSLGVPVWPAATWLNIFSTAMTVAVIYALARRQGCNHRYALLAALLFQSFSTVAFYSNIPEVYAPWMLGLALTLWLLERQQGWFAVGALGLAIWIFLPGALLLPAFSLLQESRRWFQAAVALSLGLGLHLLTLAAYGVPFLSRLASERVYWQVATSWSWYFSSTWISLLQSGMLWAALASLTLSLRLWRRLARPQRYLLLSAVPLFMAPALWVKDHGSFFLPFGLLLCLICPMLVQQWTKGARWRSNAALSLLLCLVMLNLRDSWRVVSYDRNMGQAQVEFCQQALLELPADSRVLSTALLSTWLWAAESSGRHDVACSYFPWLLRASYGAAIDRCLQELRENPGIYFVDPTVSELVTEAGRVMNIRKIAVPHWPTGQVYWDLTIVQLEADQP